MRDEAAAAGPFLHPALFYRGPREYLRETVPFVREGLAAGEPVAVAAPGERLALLRDELGAWAERMLFVDMEEAGRNPGRIIPRVLRAFADAHPGGPVRIIGEPVWAGRSEAAYPACVQHEALINHAFAGRRATILCPYDTLALPARAAADAWLTHPLVIEGGRARRSEDYAPDLAVAAYNLPLPAAPAAAAEFGFDAERLTAARHFAAGRAAELGLPAARVDEVALAVAELTTNSVLHGGGAGRLRIWAAGAEVLCEVSDAGFIRDPLAGRRPPGRDQIGGRGLLLVHCLADLVRVHTAPGGTTVRFQVGR